MLPGEMAAIMADPSRFIHDKVLAFDEGQMVMTKHAFSGRPSVPGDHTIDGVPYHPGVMAMERLLKMHCCFAQIPVWPDSRAQSLDCL